MNVETVDPSNPRKLLSNRNPLHQTNREITVAVRKRNKQCRLSVRHDNRNRNSNRA